MGITQQDYGYLLLSNDKEEDFLKRMDMAQSCLEKSFIRES